MKEIWKKIPDYPDYEVSNLGRVRSYYNNKYPERREKPKMLKLLYCPQGYHTIRLFRNFKAQSRKVHRLVLEAFVCKKPEGMECLHKDGKKDNNRLTNLRWGTRLENMKDRVRLGEHAVGERAGQAKLKTREVLKILQKLKNKEKQRNIAKEFGVSYSVIHHIHAVTTWKHIKRPYKYKKLGRGNWIRVKQPATTPEKQVGMF